MTRAKIRPFVFAVAAAAGGSCRFALASNAASDSATNYGSVYDLDTLNDGTGFAPWHQVIVAGATGGSGNSETTTTDNATNDYPQGTDVFDIFAYNGGTASGSDFLYRPLTGGALAAGQTVSFNLNISALQSTSQNAANPNGTAGFALVDAAGTTLLAFNSQGGTNSWFLTDGTQTDTDEGASVQYGYHSDRAYSFELDSINSTTASYTLTVVGNPADVPGTGTAGTATFNGTISYASGGIQQLEFFDNQGGDGSDVQFTNLNVTAAPNAPEPAALGLFAAGGLVLLRRRRGEC